MGRIIFQFFIVIVILLLGIITYAYFKPVQPQQVSCGYDENMNQFASNTNLENIDSKEIYVNSMTLTAPENQLVIAGIGGTEYYYRVEIADTLEEQAFGLMHRYRLDAKSGMLFIFPNLQTSTFWMRNTYIPLDILFLNEKGDVVDIHTNTKPQSEKYINSNQKVKAALELNAGDVNKLGIKIGTKIYHPSFD